MDKDSMSYLVCTVCNQELTQDQASVLFRLQACPYCSSSLTMASAHIRLAAHHEPLTDSTKIFDMTWYHASKRMRWLTQSQNLSGKVVHLGTQQAAFIRARNCLMRQWQNGENADWDTWKIYEVKISSDATCSQNILQDHDSFPEYLDEYSAAGYINADITRYINRYESRGEMSLLVNAQKIEIISTRQLFVAREDFFSLLNV